MPTLTVSTETPTGQASVTAITTNETLTLITIYTTENCQACRMTKRALDKEKIPYREQPLNDEIITQAKQHGYSSAPICQTSFGELWGGYDRQKIKEFVSRYTQENTQESIPALAVA